MENKTKRFTQDMFNVRINEGDTVTYNREKYIIKDFYYYTTPLGASEDHYLVLQSLRNPNKIVEFIKPSEVRSVADRNIYLSE